jgi:hypothetical protein
MASQLIGVPGKREHVQIHVGNTIGSEYRTSRPENDSERSALSQAVQPFGDLLSSIRTR